MFEQRKKDELKLVYSVFVQIEPTLQTIIDKMDPFIKAEGLKIVQSEELQKEPLPMVQKLLELKSEVDSLIADSFNNDMKF